MRAFPGAIFLALLAMTPAAAQTPAAPADCRLVRVAALALELDSVGRPTVPVTFNGQPRRMLVDTGAAISMMTYQTMVDLGLRSRQRLDVGLFMNFSGSVEDQATIVENFTVGPVHGRDFIFFVDHSWMDTSGLLGGDFYYQYDLDFDFARARLNLISPNHCPGQVVYWTAQPYGVVPFELRGNHIHLRVTLDGKEMEAILDTGAADTVMSLERAARDFDLDRDQLLRSRHYPFRTLSFGEISVGNPVIELVSDRENAAMGRNGPLQMIIGMGVLRRMHLYISYKEKMLYVTPASQY
jgi:predicted aspartyl protease